MDIKTIISQMTLEEKAGLCSGSDFWHTKAVERLGVPSIMLSDGPHGLRRQRKDSDIPNESIEAVCFPTGSAAACSFDRELFRTLGEAIGRECQAEDVQVILGPAVNMKRSPLCGRNFEYLSEDPCLAGELAASQIAGTESQGVGTSLKHFAANNQETRRMTVSAELDERTLREIYLAQFETAVKKGKPSTLMCSYNRINGVYSSENKRLLTDILRGEWGFDGLVMSDWGAVNRRPEGIAAGLDLEMPASNGVTDQEIVEAVKEGRLAESDLDVCVERVLRLVEKTISARRPDASFDREADHQLARKLAAQCMVLLKNENNLLPLDGKKPVAFLGAFAKEPRFQGGGSSHINAWKVTSALEAAQGKYQVTYAQGYPTGKDEIDEALLTEAVEAAKNAYAAVVFAGLPDSFESEGFDRSHMSMPRCHNALIEAVCRVQPNTVVVLHNGSPVEMPWLPQAPALLEAYLAGEASGGAVTDLLFGEENPSGRLAETFPKRLADTPSFLNFPGEPKKVEYREGIFIGYRYYDKKDMEVLFPFGYGLSYTQFQYSGMRVSRQKFTDQETVAVSLKVKNTGSRPGREVVQLYVESLPGPEKKMIRPVRELKGFEKVFLLPGEEKEVAFSLDSRAFACYSESLGGWFVESGDYVLTAAKSSREPVLCQTVTVQGTKALPCRFTMESSVEELMENEKARQLLQELISHSTTGMEGGNMGEGSEAMEEAMMREMPLRSFRSFGGVSTGQLQELLEKITK